MTQLPVELPIESRTWLRSGLSIDWTNDVPVEWLIDVPAEWWVELRIEVVSKVPSEMPIELPSPESSAELDCELGRERMGECGADARWKCCGLPGLRLRCDRTWATSRESGWIQESADRGRCLCRRASVLLELHGAGFRPSRRTIARRKDRSPRDGGDLWTEGAQLPPFLLRWPEKRQPCCRTPRQLPLHDDLADGLGLSLRLGLTHEVHAGAEPADVVRAGAQRHDLLTGKREERRVKSEG